MQRLVNTIALGAATVALALGVWRDYSADMALKQTLIVYLGTYFVAGGLSLATRAALTAVGDPEPEPAPEPARGKSRRKRRQAAAAKAAAASETPANAPGNESAAPEPVQAG